ncbi:VOC family protein [Pokkaliibacter sp. CJK22405]|uniref:VOC family protein n=1 Tax=Pokkaliibacter sp. CJK22405 TaxID=3384615 RepID=UPI00398554E9
MKFHHLGLVVATLEQGRRYCEDVLGIHDFSEAIEDPVQRVWVQFCEDDSGLRYELVAPATDDSPVKQALSRKQNILNHLAYGVADLTAEAERLRRLRHMPVTQPAPAVAFNGARIQFFLSPLGHLVELIEQESHHG